MTARKLLTTSELARALGISERTIQRYRASGQLVPEEETPGGQARWIEEDVRRQIKAIREG